LSKKKYRQSKQRTKILEILRKTDLHPTASWIYDRLKKEFPQLSIGTVYRNLTILIDQGMIQKIENGSTFDRFDAHTNPHYHFICDVCGGIKDIDININEQIDRIITEKLPMTIKRHKIDFYGICPECERKKK